MKEGKKGREKERRKRKGEKEKGRREGGERDIKREKRNTIQGFRVKGKIPRITANCHGRDFSS